MLPAPCSLLPSCLLLAAFCPLRNFCLKLKSEGTFAPFAFCSCCCCCCWVALYGLPAACCLLLAACCGLLAAGCSQKQRVALQLLPSFAFGCPFAFDYAPLLLTTQPLLLAMQRKGKRQRQKTQPLFLFLFK
jgi:hypothetical protein